MTKPIPEETKPKVVLLDPLADAVDYPRDDRSGAWTSCSTVRWGTSPASNWMPQSRFGK